MKCETVINSEVGSSVAPPFGTSVYHCGWQCGREEMPGRKKQKKEKKRKKRQTGDRLLSTLTDSAAKKNYISQAPLPNDQ